MDFPKWFTDVYRISAACSPFARIVNLSVAFQNSVFCLCAMVPFTVRGCFVMLVVAVDATRIGRHDEEPGI